MMKINQILNEIKTLGETQEPWDRLYKDLMNEKDSGHFTWDATVKMLEEEEFDDVQEIVEFFENGKSKFGIRARFVDMKTKQPLSPYFSGGTDELVDNFENLLKERGIDTTWLKVVAQNPVTLALIVKEYGYDIIHERFLNEGYHYYSLSGALVASASEQSVIAKNKEDAWGKFVKRFPDIASQKDNIEVIEERQGVGCDA